MRYLLVIPLLALIFLPSNVEAITGSKEIFVPLVGTPEIVADASNACNNQARVLFLPHQGMPEAVLDSTATCTATASSGTRQDVIWFE